MKKQETNAQRYRRYYLEVKYGLEPQYESLDDLEKVNKNLRIYVKRDLSKFSLFYLFSLILSMFALSYLLKIENIELFNILTFLIELALLIISLLTFYFTPKIPLSIPFIISSNIFVFAVIVRITELGYFNNVYLFLILYFAIVVVLYRFYINIEKRYYIKWKYKGSKVDDK